MYYSHPCPYCGRLFMTEHSNKTRAAQALYDGIKQHQKDYDEDRKEYTMDEDPRTEVNQMYKSMSETEERPGGAYEVS